jgi:membrane-associated protease RseP (regulator of RpoE activity)
MREDYGEDRFDWILYASGRKNRVVVDSVFGPSAAGEADLRPGDLILRYGESRIFNGRELRQATIEGEAGQLVPVEYERAGEVHRVFLPRGPVGVQLHEATLPPSSS